MMEDNVPGFIGYHITRDGKLYSRRLKLFKILIGRTLKFLIEN